MRPPHQHLHLPRTPCHAGRRLPLQLPPCATPDDADRPCPPPLDPVAAVSYGGTLPSRRRLLLGGSAAAVTALIGNFAGVTSRLLSSSDGVTAAARSARLDVIYPLRNRKRAWSSDDGFEFTYPSRWLADATVARRVAERGERARPIDPLMSTPTRARPAEPVLAFGPPGSTGETNVSAVVAPIEPGFGLTQLGDAASAAEEFVRTLAPPGSPRVATVLASSSRVDENGTLYYEWSYRVSGPAFNRINFSAVAARGARVRGGRPQRPQLITLNAQGPAAAVEGDSGLAAALAECAASFRIER